MRRWHLVCIGGFLLIGPVACSGSSSSTVSPDCPNLGPSGAFKISDGTAGEIPPDMVPDSIKQVAAVTPPDLQGGRRALRDDVEYPEEASENRTGGVVHVSFVVDTNGHPQNVEVSRGAGYAFNQAALDAVRRQRFEPATQDGRPVCFPMTLPINFRT